MLKNPKSKDFTPPLSPVFPHRQNPSEAPIGGRKRDHGCGLACQEELVGLLLGHAHETVRRVTEQGFQICHDFAPGRIALDFIRADFVLNGLVHPRSFVDTLERESLYGSLRSNFQLSSMFGMYV